MKRFIATILLSSAALFFSTERMWAQSSGQANVGWQHSGALTILTTPDGANLPAGAAVEGFPLLVRLHRDWFDFKQAKADGADVRFADHAGKALAYQVEEWDAAGGTASIWVRVPLKELLA